MIDSHSSPCNSLIGTTPARTMRAAMGLDKTPRND